MDPESFSLISYFAVFGAGLALSFSPCVFPLVPVVMAVIGSSGELSRRKNFFLALVYVSGMALTFSFLGAAAALTGSLFGQMLEHAGREDDEIIPVIKKNMNIFEGM